MHTVAQTHAFVRAAKDAGMDADEISDLVSYLAENPTAGDVMQGTGGCRKVRIGTKDKGKRGGYRTITFYTGERIPVFLITVFAKGERVDLTKAERNSLRKVTEALVTEYNSRVTSVADRKGA